MGLKTTNYEIKKLGITLPNAYAMVKDLVVQGKTGYANIIVQSSRENAYKVLDGRMQALEEVRVDFTVSRDTNDRATAYAEAKKETIEKRYNMQYKMFEHIPVQMPFFGWEDDIVEV
jgi:hypothetical protein